MRVIQREKESRRRKPPKGAHSKSTTTTKRTRPDDCATHSRNRIFPSGKARRRDSNYSPAVASTVVVVIIILYSLLDTPTHTHTHWYTVTFTNVFVCVFQGLRDVENAGYVGAKKSNVVPVVEQFKSFSVYEDNCDTQVQLQAQPHVGKPLATIAEKENIQSDAGKL